jgi:cell shape-determining protein MreC
MRSSISIILPFVALLAALTLPPAAEGVRVTSQRAFAPVAYPSRVVGHALDASLRTPPAVDLYSDDVPKTLEEARFRLEATRVHVANLQAQLADLRVLSSQYAQFDADLRKLIQPASVTAGPTDQRQTLTISTIGVASVREGSAVVSPLGVVGQVNAVGIGSARVLLLTDPTSRVEGRFVRYVAREDGAYDAVTLAIAEKPLVEGAGEGAMIARAIPAASVREKLKVGDVVVLDDPRFAAPALKGMRLGVVAKINLPPTDAGHASVELSPTVDFRSMKEAMVVRTGSN